MWELDTTKCNVAGLSPYMFFAGTGLMVVLALYPFLLLKRNCKIDVFMPRLMWSLPAVFIGAKLLGIILNILKCIQNSESICKETFVRSGIIYYGGLISIILTFFYLSKYKNDRNPLEVNDAFDSFVILIPLFHVFGRIGCFFSGCCYGIERKTFVSVLYTINSVENGISTSWRIPTQLIEAFFEFFVFVLLLLLFMKNRCKGKLLNIYLIVYSVGRFWMELIRGDIVRGCFFFLSTSQWISCCLFIYVIIKLVKMKGNEENG